MSGSCSEGRVATEAALVGNPERRHHFPLSPQTLPSQLLSSLPTPPNCPEAFCVEVVSCPLPPYPSKWVG